MESPSLTNLDTASFIFIILSDVISLPLQIGCELESVPYDSLFSVDLLELGLDGHAHLDFLGVHIRHLANYLGTLGELGGCAARPYQDERVHLALPAQLKLLELRGGVAVLAYALGREVHGSAL